MFEQYQIDFHNVMGHWVCAVWRIERSADGTTRQTRLYRGDIDPTACEGDVDAKDLLWEAFCAAAIAESPTRHG